MSGSNIQSKFCHNKTYSFILRHTHVRFMISLFVFKLPVSGLILEMRSFIRILLNVQKVTGGNELSYTSIIGKPSEISFRYAEHCLTDLSQEMFREDHKPLTTLYMIGSVQKYLSFNCDAKRNV